MKWHCKIFGIHAIFVLCVVMSFIGGYTPEKDYRIRTHFSINNHQYSVCVHTRMIQINASIYVKLEYCFTYAKDTLKIRIEVECK